MGFDAFGETVPHDRVAAGERALAEMVPEFPTHVRLSILTQFIYGVEHDQPAPLLTPNPPAPLSGLDVVGRYRLLATLLTA